jgi:3-oxosteroid 1-dehydrogenase
MPHADYETDILIVGSGATGMTAALKAADCGAQVLVVEKSALFGGTSALSGAVLWIPLSDQAQALGFPDSQDEAVTYITSLAGPEDVFPKLIQAFVQNAPATFRFLEETASIQYRPILFPDYHAENPGGKNGNRSHDSVPFDGRALGSQLKLLRPSHPSTMFLGFISWTAEDVAPLLTRQRGWMRSLTRVLWRYYSDVGQRLRSRRPRFLTGGNALMARLKLALDRKGVPLWLNSPFRDLIVEGGRVTGAVVERDGVEYCVRTRRGVILAAGGFERNPALREAYLGRGSPNPDWSASQSCNTGDALVAAMNIGAATVRMQNAWWSPVLRIPGEDLARPLFVERALPGCIMVDSSGKRFTNEAASYHIVGREMVRLNRSDDAPGGPYHLLFDTLFRQRYPMGPIYPGIPNFLLSKAVQSTFMTAETWEELAAKIGVSANALCETIARFNENAAKGTDPDFGRGDTAYDKLFGDARVGANPNLGPLLKPPFYAMPVYPGDISTCGGIVTDEVGAVLDENSNRIPGLYAVGNTAATAMGFGYAGGGATLAPGMTFAFLAARHAATEDHTAKEHVNG